MWIMLNGEPVNVFNIAKISGLMKIDSMYLAEQYKNLFENCVDVFLPKDKPEGETSFEDLQKDAKEKNTIWGYMFYVTVGALDERGQYYRYRVLSKTYKKESAAKAALEYLLTELNDIEGRVRKIEI